MVVIVAPVLDQHPRLGHAENSPTLKIEQRSDNHAPRSCSLTVSVRLCLRHSTPGQLKWQA